MARMGYPIDTKRLRALYRLTPVTALWFRGQVWEKADVFLWLRWQIVEGSGVQQRPAQFPAAGKIDAVSVAARAARSEMAGGCLPGFSRPVARRHSRVALLFQT